MLLLIICTLRAVPATPDPDVARLLHLIWRHATVADGLEHLRPRSDAGVLHLAAFLRCEPPGEARAVLRRLIRRALDREAELRRWHLIDDTGNDQGARHP